MTPHIATPTAVPLIWRPKRPLCPRCGETMVAPEIAEFAGCGRIRHTWTCEACEHEFRTSVQIPVC